MYFQEPNHDMHWSSQRGMRALLQRQLEFDNLWESTHFYTLPLSALVVMTSSGVFLISDYVDCDGHSPYGQAALSGLYTFALFVYMWIYAANLLTVSKELERRISWSLEVKQRRRRRVSFWLAIVACGQYLAAVAFGLSAFRTFRAPLGLLGLAPIVAALTM